jgi:AraC-like DNA-binding protein
VVQVAAPGQLSLMAGALDSLTRLTERGLVGDRRYAVLAAAATPLAVVAPLLNYLPPQRLALEHGLPHKPTMACMRAIQATTEPIRQARDWIARHFAESWTADTLAAMMGLSPPHFRRLFRQQIGKTPMAFRDAIRVRNMVSLLLETTSTVGSVAAQVGWPKADHAIRVFKVAVGLTPAEYRARFAVHTRAQAAPLAYPDPINLYPDPIMFEH